MFNLVYACIYLFYAFQCAFIDPMNHEITQVNPKVFESLLNRQRSASSVTIVLHYSENNKDHEKYIHGIFNDAAKLSKGMIRFLAIDCSTETQFCKQVQKSEVSQDPIVFVYPANAVIPPQNLGSKPSQQTMIRVASQYIPGDHIETLNETSYENFISTSPAIPKLILYSTKDSAPVMLKALSNTFKDRIAFGMIPASMNSLDQKLKVKKRPAIYIVRSSKKPEHYTGGMNYSELHAWINIYAETFVKGGGFSESDSVREQAKKPWLTQRLPEITRESFSDLCVKSNSICLIYLVKDEITKDEISMLHGLINEYNPSGDRGARFRWGWMNLELESNFAQLFNIAQDKFPSIVALNTHKRPRYFLLQSDRTATLENIKYFMEKLVSGDARFTIIKGQKIPTLATRNENSTPSPSKVEL